MRLKSSDCLNFFQNRGDGMRNDIIIRTETTKDYKDIISLILRSFKKAQTINSIDRRNQSI